jgi:hypothetical protein
MTTSSISFLGLGVFLLEIIINGTLLALLIRRWKECKLKVIAILCGMYFLYLFFIAFELTLFTLHFDDPVTFYLQDKLVITLLPFFGGISAGFFLLFIDYFLTDKVSPVHSAIYGAYLGSFILNAIYLIVIPEIFGRGDLVIVPESQSLFTIVLIFLDILFSTNFPVSYFVIYVLFITLHSLNKIKSQIQEAAQKKQIIYMQSTIVFYYFFTMVLIVAAFQLANSFDPVLHVFIRHIAPHISLIIGSIMMYFAYVKAKTGFLQFQRIEKVMVINRAGLLLFSYDFGLEETKSEQQDLLLSGGVFAVLTLFSELIKSRNIQLIHFQDKNILLSHNDNFIVFLMVDRVTGFLWGALESFNRMFNLNYSSEFQELAVVPKHLFNDAEVLLKLAFGLQ